MTFKEKIQAHLKEMLLGGQEIEAIMASVMNDKDLLETMGKRWNARIDGYPTKLTTLILTRVEAIALEWLKENKPKHFVIPYLGERVHGAPIPKAKEID